MNTDGPKEFAEFRAQQRKDYQAAYDAFGRWFAGSTVDDSKRRMWIAGYVSALVDARREP